MKKNLILLTACFMGIFFLGCGKSDYSHPNIKEETSSNEETSPSIELKDYMGQPISLVSDDFENMQDIGFTDGSLGYSSGSVTFEGREGIITYISIDESCNYTLEGVSHGMEKESALQHLSSAGWASAQSQDTICRFQKGESDSLFLYLKDGEHVSAVTFFGAQPVPAAGSSSLSGGETF